MDLSSAIDSVLLTLLVMVPWVVLWVLPVASILFAGYYLISLPLRRQERARFFLDLIETGLRDGRSVEQTVVSISAAGDSSMGLRFHLLAARIEQGQSFAQALLCVPQFLPPGIASMLNAGLEAGDVRKTIPACRRLLKDALSQTRGALNYLMVLAFIVTPATVLVISVIEVVILPKCLEIVATMVDGVGSAAGIQFLARHSQLVVGSQFLLLFLVWCAAFVYVGGPRMLASFEYLLGGLTDRILYALPWRRKRMQRDFSAVLAVLLDAGMTETAALELAGECAANCVFLRGAQRAQAALRDGGRLADAVALIDGTGEFRWRLSQAAGAGSGFFAAIAGWNESLDARAFAQEQASAQLVTTGLVLLNGAFVALVVISVFGMLISIINAGLLW